VFSRAAEIRKAAEMIREVLTRDPDRLFLMETVADDLEAMQLELQQLAGLQELYELYCQCKPVSAEQVMQEVLQHLDMFPRGKQ